MTHDEGDADAPVGERFFESLEHLLSLQGPPSGSGFKRDLPFWAAIAIGMLLVSLPFARLSGQPAAMVISWAGLALQLIGLVMVAYRQGREIAPDFIDARRKYAVALDKDFADRNALLAWLRSRPALERSSRLEFARFRLENIRSRYPLVFGPIDRLGFLPAVVAVFIQMQAMKSFSGLVMLGGIFIVALYGMSLWITGYRLQVERYVRLLEDAQVSGHEAAVVGSPGGTDQGGEQR